MILLTPMPPTVTYKTRDYHYERVSGHDLADGRLTLEVRRGNQRLDTTYALQCERDESGFLHTVYLAKERSEDGEVYGIEFSLRGACRCSCFGHARHGTCKHADAVADLVKKGKLDPVAAVPADSRASHRRATGPTLFDEVSVN